MSINRKAAIGILLGASALVMPQMAHAGTSREAQLLTRLERLEAEMAQLRADLANAKSAQADTAAAADAAKASLDDARGRRWYTDPLFKGEVAFGGGNIHCITQQQPKA